MTFPNPFKLIYRPQSDHLAAPQSLVTIRICQFMPEMESKNGWNADPSFF
jgi:hypothetical protein